MSRNGTIAALVLATCLSAFSHSHADSNELITAPCENLDECLFSDCRVDFIELVWSVTDASDPFLVEHDNNLCQEYHSAIQRSDLPEDTKQHLLLLLAVLNLK